MSLLLPMASVRRLVGVVGLVAAVGLLSLVLAQSAAGQVPPSPSDAAGSVPSSEPSASPSPAPTQVVLDVPLASPNATLGPLLPAPPAPSPIAHPSDGKSNTCYACHIAVDDTQKAISTSWANSVHGKAGVGCADCHGGDPTSEEITVAMSKANGFIGKPTRSQAVGVCGSCHSDDSRMHQYGLSTDQWKYYTSAHGQLLLKGDTRTAICVDCHGSHDIKKASDPTAAVYPLNVPKLCSSCHSNPTLMEPYGIPTNQFDIYQNSIHGQLLLQKQDVRAPTCASCHGSHDAKLPNPDDVLQICGKCHTATLALYQESRHSKLSGVGPVCVTCHGNHDVVLPDESRFFHPTAPKFDCSTCHNPVNQQSTLQVDRFKNDADRRCDTCHHSGSDIYAQAQGIATSVQKAAAAYATAEDHIKQAAGVGMIVSDADVALSEANTSLIKARAAVHTTKLSSIAALAEDVVAKATKAQQVADAKLQENTFRREAMVVVVGIILVNVGALVGLRRRVHRKS